MKTDNARHVYGPVPSRRLGRSLGIDLVPFKTCTYDCVYCQLGRTTDLTLDRAPYVPADALVAECMEILGTTERPDIISLAGSGEPTLNSQIGAVIHGIKQQTDIPVAVLTNGSLLWAPDVQDALMAADLILPSLDAGSAALFQRINRPHPDLSFDRMVSGLADFSRRFAGQIWLEVLLLAGLTDSHAEVDDIAAYVEQIQPARVQLNTVCRPPAEISAAAVDADRLQALAGRFPCAVDIVHHKEGNDSAATSSRQAREADILALLERRPCTPRDVAAGLNIHVNEAIKHLEALTTAGRLQPVAKDQNIFYTLPTKKD